ncbi:ribbon-helix-helix protein, CopG family [Candidatus Uhrbacteria bacterium]|nr:ribbon-helix-helix protein, CopG family [Candidatus Uhrbacteria bacterium]
MARTVFTTTISLPKTMAATLKQMEREEGRTTSGLIQEALRHYERFHRFESGRRHISWNILKKDLARISKAGRQNVNLADAIARDRLSH